MIRLQYISSFRKKCTRDFSHNFQILHIPIKRNTCLFETDLKELINENQFVIIFFLW